MNKQLAADDTLRELWAIKDETAARFKTVAQYFEYLTQSSRSPQPRSPATSPVQKRPRAAPRTTVADKRKLLA